MAVYRLLFQITLYTMMVTSFVSAFKCTSSNSCHCYESKRAMYEYYCPPVAPAIITRIRLPEVQVECLEGIDWQTQSVPNLDMDRLGSLSVSMCPLPKFGLDHILTKFGINSTERFAFSFTTEIGNGSMTSQDEPRLNSVRMLDLSNNGIEQLDEHEFASLSEVVRLDLSNNFLTDIPSKLFVALTNLKVLSLASNSIQSLPEDLFASNLLLEDLDISSNPIDLARLPFKGPSSLKKLGLGKNHIMSLPERFFANLTQLEELDLSNNQIATLPEFVFHPLTRLKTINLAGNSLTHITKGLLYNQRNLETINLRNNVVSFVNVHAFQQNVKLKEIILANNKFKLPQIQMNMGISPFQANLNLETLDLSHNLITDISDDWVLSKVHLKALDLSHNEISSLALTDLMGVSQNLSINLSHNKISTVDFRMANHIDPLTHNLQQRVVLLNENPIQCNCFIYDFAKYFDGTINPLIPATIMLIADNLKCTGPEHLLNVPITQVKSNTLICQVKNCPKKCNCGFRAWDRALIMDCSYKNLKDAPSLLIEKTELYNYTEVNLEGNSLRRGPSENMGYENVDGLNLAFNNISDISWIPPSVQVLDLSNNNLEHLEEKFLYSLQTSPRLENLSLGNNPWKCGCSALNLRSFMITHLISKRMIDANSVKCKNDKRLLIHLSINDACLTFSSLIVLCSLILALIATSTSILTCICAFSKRKRLYSNF